MKKTSGTSRFEPSCRALPGQDPTQAMHSVHFSASITASPKGAWDGNSILIWRWLQVCHEVIERLVNRVALARRHIMNCHLDNIRGFNFR